MARKRRRDKPFDFAFTIMDNEFPEELHINLNVPEYIRKKSIRKYTSRMGALDEWIPHIWLTQIL